MNILIDTNILIPLEDTGRFLEESYALLKRQASEVRVTLKIHPSQRDDISRDKNENRKKIVLSRVSQYSPIPDPPIWQTGELQSLGIAENNDNDRIDNELLCSVYRNAVNILVTEDKNIHQKARLLKIEDRVHFLTEAITFLKSLNPSQIHSEPPLGIKECHLHRLRKENKFFDSLRSAYRGFDEWFDKCARENRKAWIVEDDQRILALVIRKLEEAPVVTQSNQKLHGRCLKLCTFKVSNAWRGKKLGERLLYTVFKHASQNEIRWVYFTADEDKQQQLIELAEDFGFTKIGIDIKGRDAVYCKDMQKPSGSSNLSNIEYAIRYYPNYRVDESTKRWIVPIQRRFHEILFPDISNIKDTFFKDDPTMFKASANTIKKAYLCHAQVRTMKPGDLVYFYRSEDRQSIECLGIVEHTLRTSNAQEILSHVSKRTVYSVEDIQQIAQNETLVILFRLIDYIDSVSFAELQEKGLQGNIQSIRELTFQI